MNIQRAITILNLALIALGAYFAAGLFYQIWGLQLKPSEPALIAKSPETTSHRRARKSYSAYRPILQRDLFKTRKETASPIKKTDINLDEMSRTELKLKLWGTVSGDAEKSYAVIENTQNRQQNLYRVGDSIENATVKLILRSKVVLAVNGRDEILAMEELKQSTGTSRIPRRSSQRISPRPGGIRKQRVSLRRNMINEAMQDVSKLMTQIKITPHVGENGQQAGLAVSNIKPNSIFRRMGLRNGDVLKSVDGQNIQSVDDALRLYENLKSTDSVSVMIQRRGRDRTIEYRIR
ncbi:MAG: type II secretion system protein GspC [Desulfobacteraceae bacterium]|jgi:general secretion pathway protein C